ncbi:MAG: sulfatase-like hydrolase/transferase [Planctomycetota bacterium]
MIRLTALLCLSSLFLACTKAEGEADLVAPAATHATAMQNDDGLPPDIILILADDLGYGDWAPTGGPMRTPYLTQLCADGVRLDQYRTYPICTPTRTALMGGMAPIRYGMAFSPLRNWEQRSFPRDLPTLAERLHDTDYQTAIVGKWHLGLAEKWMLPNQRGFDHFYGFLTGSINYASHTNGHSGLDWQRNGVSVDEEGYSTTLFGEEAARWIGEQSVEKPLFLYLPFNAPHTPVIAPVEFTKRYKEEVPDLARRKFCGMVDAMDDAIGTVLAAVEKRGRSNNTLVIFLSDNGASLKAKGSNGNLRGSKGGTYEGGIRVPAVVRWPAQFPAGAVSHDLVDVLDWVPTILQAAAVEDLSSFDGRSVISALSHPITDTGETTARNDLFYVASTQKHISYSVVRWPWKCVRRVRKVNQGLSVQLFRLDTDPQEAVDVKVENPEILADLTTAIDVWFAQMAPDEDMLAPSECIEKAAPSTWKEPQDWATFSR